MGGIGKIRWKVFVLSAGVCYTWSSKIYHGVIDFVNKS